MRQRPGENVTRQKRQRNTKGETGGNTLATSAKAIGTTLGQLAIKASEVAAAGQKEALLPGLTPKDSRKRTTPSKKVRAKEAAINRVPKPAAQRHIND